MKQQPESMDFVIHRITDCFDTIIRFTNKQKTFEISFRITSQFKIEEEICYLRPHKRIKFVHSKKTNNQSELRLTQLVE